MGFAEGSFRSASDGTTIATYAWGAAIADPRGVVQIAHGVAEHSLRYARLAAAFNAAGYRVFASDHRGHGRSIAGEADLGDFGAGGWDGLVEDVVTYGAMIAELQPDVPLILLGHSMGSFASQQVILEHSAQYAGVVLSGSTALDVLAASLGGSEEPVGLTAFNAAFDHRTGYEWLSRDTVEVDAYVADPLSGFDLPDATLPALLSSAARLADPAALRAVRSDLPILIISGQADPLAGDGQLVALLAQRYRDAQVADVTVQVYPEARHEIFNETNRDEITAAVIAWLNAHCP